MALRQRTGFESLWYHTVYDEQLGPRRHGVVARAKYLEGTRIIPVVDEAGEKIEVSGGRHGSEYVAAYDLAPVRNILRD